MSRFSLPPKFWPPTAIFARSTTQNYVIFFLPAATRIAVSKIITWTSEPKSAEVRKVSAIVYSSGSGFIIDEWSNQIMEIFLPCIHRRYIVDYSFGLTELWICWYAPEMSSVGKLWALPLVPAILIVPHAVQCWQRRNLPTNSVSRFVRTSPQCIC